MTRVLHHLGEMGWGWVAAFVVADLIATACALLTLVRSERKLRTWALFGSAGAAMGAIVTTGAAVVFGLVRSSWLVGASGVDVSTKARVLAQGISTSMNAMVFGPVFTLIAALATVVSLVAVLRGGTPSDGSREKSRPVHRRP